MNSHPELNPQGLSRRQFQHLQTCVLRAATIEPAALVSRASDYLCRVENEAGRNRLVNVRLATALQEKFGLLILEWERLPEVARPWLAGAIYYFSAEQDDEPDLVSSIGFEDDVAVFNACVRFARREEHCLVVEDFDHG